MRAPDSRRATGHDSRVAVKQRPGTRKPEGKRPEAAMQNAGGFFMVWCVRVMGVRAGEPSGSPVLSGLPYSPFGRPPVLEAGRFKNRNWEPRQMNAITQVRPHPPPAVESLIVEGLITVKIGPRRIFVVSGRF